MMNKFKYFLNKKDFNYSKGVINPYEFHKYFYWFSKAFLILDNEHVVKKYSYIHTFFILNTIFSIFMAVLGFYNGIRTLDIIVITQGGSYIILFSYTLLILVCQKINVPCYHNFQKSLREDFYYVCTEGQRYRDRFFESQLVTWKLCIACFFFPVSAALLVLAALSILFYYLATHDANDGTERPLLFPVWFFDVEVSATPYYELLFFYTTYTIMMIGYVYGFMTQTEIVWVRHITTKADLIIYAIQDLMEDIHPTSDPERKEYDNILLKKRLRNIVIQHHSMFRLLQDYAGVYKKMLMYEQKLGGPVLTFTAFGTTKQMSSSGEFNPVLIILFMATFFVCVLPSYMCTYLREKIRLICDTCWDTRFWDASPVVRPYLVLIMQRSLRPLPLQAPGFEDVSLQTFSSKIAAAYSMFNMLRQTNLGD